jgi:hypothetical protein
VPHRTGYRAGTRLIRGLLEEQRRSPSKDVRLAPDELALLADLKAGRTIGAPGFVHATASRPMIACRWLGSNEVDHGKDRR